MNREDAILTTKTLSELTESCKDLYCGLKGVSGDVVATEKLWHEVTSPNLCRLELF